MPRFRALGALAGAVVFALLACGGFGSSNEAMPSSDGGADADAFVPADAHAESTSADAGRSDAGDDAACDLAAPFGQPSPLHVVGEGTMFIATLTPDETTIYYDSESAPGVSDAKIFRAQRLGLDASFGSRTAVDVLNARQAVFFSPRALPAPPSSVDPGGPRFPRARSSGRLPTMPRRSTTSTMRPTLAFSSRSGARTTSRPAAASPDCRVAPILRT